MRIRALSLSLSLHPLSPSLTFIHLFIQQICVVPSTVLTRRTNYNGPDAGQTMAGNKDRIWGSTLFLRPFLRMLGMPHLEATERPLQRVSEPFLGNNGQVGLSEISVFKNNLP